MGCTLNARNGSKRAVSREKSKSFRLCVSIGQQNDIDHVMIESNNVIAAGRSSTYELDACIRWWDKKGQRIESNGRCPSKFNKISCEAHRFRRQTITNKILRKVSFISVIVLSVILIS